MTVPQTVPGRRADTDDTRDEAVEAAVELAAEDLDAQDYDFEPPARDNDAEWADAGGYGPGPGPRPGGPYPQGGASHLGWTR